MSLFAAALLLASCSDDAKPSDAGKDVTVSEAGTDGGSDAGLDVSLPDYGPDAPTSRCSIETLAPLKLDEGAYCVAYRLELPAVPTAFAVRGGSVYTFGETSTAKTFEVSEQTFDIKSGILASPIPFYTFAVTSSEALFGSMFLALSPGGKIASGYNTSSPTNPTGKVYIASHGGTPSETQADGNFDAAFVDDTTLLVNGSAAGTLSGQGVYVIVDGKAPALLIKDIGDFSGPVVVTKDIVYAGGYFSGANEGRMYAFTLAEIKAAIAGGTQLVASDGDLAFSGNQLGAAGLDGDLAVARADSSFAFTAVSRYSATVNGDAVSIGSASDIITAGSAGMFGNIESDGASLVVQFTDADSKPVLAIVDKK
ncbi:MAG: hypothetical protein KC503_23180 [Myxococcales bacterium]|nr:hypothetical protein [Myxococcales bacterium]